MNSFLIGCYEEIDFILFGNDFSIAINVIEIFNFITILELGSIRSCFLSGPNIPNLIWNEIFNNASCPSFTKSYHKNQAF
jgi:hypothetical protein